MIATAGTILTFIFGASYFLEELPKSLLFHLSNMIFCTAIGYIDSLGISNVIRYHYLQNLEDRLLMLSPEQPSDQLVHWMSFSAPITTRNIKNLRYKYPIIHYFCYAIATICAVLFCVFITVFQFILLENYSVLDRFGIALFIIFSVFSTFAFFYSSIKAKHMYDFSLDESKKRQAKRLRASKWILSPEQTQKMKDTKSKKRVAKNGNLKSIVKLISYLIYPKKKDFQKPILLVLGFLTGKLFVGGQINVGYSLKQLFILFFVVDFLIYQARYQWNDIRGLTEDIDSGKEDRLFCILSTEGQPNAGERKKAKRAVIVSLITMVLKIIVACFIILVVDNQMFFPLLSCSVLGTVHIRQDVI